MFNKAIVRKPAESIINGISSHNLGEPEYKKAVKQHVNYVESLKDAGIKEIKILDKDEKYPDSCFVEDTAVLTAECAIISRIGVNSRKGEAKRMKKVLEDFFDNIKNIRGPGKLEGGDVMRVEDKFYIGISQRTDEKGADQLCNILNKYGYEGIKIHFKNYLHLKSGLSYLRNNTLLANSYFAEFDEFKDFDIIKVDTDEEYAANSIWVNGYVIVPEGFEKTKKKVEKEGYPVITVDTSEFRKLDGGASCLSLRF